MLNYSSQVHTDLLKQSHVSPLPKTPCNEEESGQVVSFTMFLNPCCQLHGTMTLSYSLQTRQNHILAISNKNTMYFDTTQDNKILNLQLHEHTHS